MAIPKRVLIVDDHLAMRRAVTRVLESQPNVVVCGEAENGRRAIEEAERLKPDLIVLDLSMPIMNGLEEMASISLYVCWKIWANVCH